MSNRTRLLNIIDRYIATMSNIPSDLEQQLAAVKGNLQQLTDEQFEKISDNVFSSPANEHHYNQDNPNYVLQSLYGEMERVARNEQNNPEVSDVIREMQHYYGITEKDGYFP